jgi:hypothetical protein
MILSIHVPKSGGNSLRRLLQLEYGERLLLDYGDWAGFKVPEAIQRCKSRAQKARSNRKEIAEKYDIIHGHFATDKYLNLFARQEFVAFFRDPYQQALSHYYFLLRNPQREHLEEKMFHEAKMTLHDYLRWEAFRDQQSQYLGSLTVEDLTMVGLSEEFNRSLELFHSLFGRRLQEGTFLNVNPDHVGRDYEIDSDVRRAVEKYRAADIDMYRRAKDIFKKQTSDSERHHSFVRYASPA